MSIGEAFDPVLAAAQDDAQWAFDRLYRDLAPVVLGYLRLHGAWEPEDLASEVFLGAFAGLGRFRGTEEQFRSWVFTIAYRRLADERRRGRAQPAFDGAAGVGDQEGGNVEVDALSRLGELRMRQLCQTISPAQRDVVLLRWVADLPLDRVATLLGKSTGAVKALQSRGLTALRERLEH